MSGIVETVVQRAKAEKRAYTRGEERPLGSYAALVGGYSAAVVGLVGASRLLGREAPERPHPGDIALAGVATLRLTRLVARAPILSPLRAPFTEYHGTSGPAELSESVRGRGVRKAIGELLTCPFCLSQWTATAFTFGLVVAPRATRVAATVLTIGATSDVLQLAYSVAERHAEGNPDG